MIRAIHIASLVVGVAIAGTILRRKWIELERELRRGM